MNGASPDCVADAELKKRPLSSSSASSSANATPRKRFEEGDSSLGDDLRRDSILYEHNTQNSPMSTMAEAGTSGHVEEALEMSGLPMHVALAEDVVLEESIGEVEVCMETPLLTASRPTSTAFETVIAFDKSDLEDILKSLTPEREINFRRRSASARLSRCLICYSNVL